jgi:hypothetical protein
MKKEYGIALVVIKTSARAIFTCSHLGEERFSGDTEVENGVIPLATTAAPRSFMQLVFRRWPSDGTNVTGDSVKKYRRLVLMIFCLTIILAVTFYLPTPRRVRITHWPCFLQLPYAVLRRQ